MINRIASAFGVYEIRKETRDKIFSSLLIVVGILVIIYLLMKVLDIPSALYINVFGVNTEFSFMSLAMIVLFWADGNLYIREHQMGLSNRKYSVAAAVVSISVLLSVAFHEFAHGFVSQVVFNNPIQKAGFSFWGAFVSPTYNLTEMSPMQEIGVAFAGPLANILLGYIALVIVWTKGESLFENSVQYIGSINFRLAKLNLIPIVLILDGGKVLHGFIRMLGFNNKTVFIQYVVGTLIFVGYKYWMKDKEPIEKKLAKL